MAKQKVVLKLSMEDAKKRAKAMQCAVGVHGVISASHEGDKMTVVGDGIDSVTLTTLLRKKMGYVELVMVTMVEEKEKKQENKEVKVEAGANGTAQHLILPYYYGQCADIIELDYHQNNCCIM